MKEFVEKLIGRLEEEKLHYFLTIANTGDEKLDAIYEAVANAIDTNILIVNQLAEEYKPQLNDNDLMIVESLPSLYPMKEFEEEALQRVIGCAKKEYNNGWIVFTQREMTEEEKEVYGEDLEYILDCKLPDDGEEIIVCYKNGYVDTDTFIRDTDGCYLDSGNDFIDDVIAWMPLPAPYQKGE